ncbi:zinc finger protein 287-like [Uranotaenia lowii]|uniref:zinc finger protein 287-like n=1 Tax=Uranotaenia lowii TaxID=190385 RepID=UPI002478FF7E|nr:zinc finger protein 287-like [Uranotaenia lowii]
MACAVPTCQLTAAECGDDLRPFPPRRRLAERWLQAIQVGCGVAAQEDIIPGGISNAARLKRMLICADHFVDREGVPAGDYQEPTLFCDSSGNSIEVASCLLCLQFHVTSGMVNKMKYRNESFVLNDYQDVLEDNELNFELICSECVARIDICNSIKKFFDEKMFREYPRLQKICSTEGAFRNDYHDEVSFDHSYEKLNRLNKKMKLDKVRDDKESYSRNNLKTLQEIKCHICDTIFKNQNDLLEHLNEIHSKGSDFNCEECNQSFEKVTWYNQHLRLHAANDRPYKCKKCSMGFYVWKHLKEHQQVHINESPNTSRDSVNDESQCSACDLKFKNDDAMRRHKQMHHSKEYQREKQLRTCGQCGKVFDTYLECIVHKKSEHQLSKTAKSANQGYRCRLCKARFVGPLKLDRHIKTKHPKAKYPYIKCPKCEQKFFTEYDVRVHLKTKKHAKNREVVVEDELNGSVSNEVTEAPSPNGEKIRRSKPTFMLESYNKDVSFTKECIIELVEKEPLLIKIRQKLTSQDPDVEITKTEKTLLCRTICKVFFQEALYNDMKITLQHKMKLAQVIVEAYECLQSDDPDKPPEADFFWECGGKKTGDHSGFIHNWARNSQRNAVVAGIRTKQFERPKKNKKTPEDIFANETRSSEPTLDEVDDFDSFIM